MLKKFSVIVLLISSILIFSSCGNQIYGVWYEVGDANNKIEFDKETFTDYSGSYDCDFKKDKLVVNNRVIEYEIDDGLLTLSYDGDKEYYTQDAPKTEKATQEKKKEIESTKIPSNTESSKSLKNNSILKDGFAEIVFPASTLKGLNTDDLIETYAEMGYDSKINSDGSFTYFYPEEKYNAEMDAGFSKIDNLIASFLGDKERYPAIISIEYAEDLSSVSILVNKAEYEPAYEYESIADTLAFAIFYFKIFYGIDPVTISQILDSNSNEIIYSYTKYYLFNYQDEE